MPNNNSNHLNQAYEYWRDNHPLEAGRLIFENLPKEVRPNWAANILQSVIKRTGIKSPPIEQIVHIASRPCDWNKAHEAYEA